jgi:hypothetical protein
MPTPTIPIQLPRPVRKTQYHGPRNNGTVNDRNAKNKAIPINITIIHHLEEENSKRRTPKKGRDIGNNVL